MASPLHGRWYLRSVVERVMTGPLSLEYHGRMRRAARRKIWSVSGMVVLAWLAVGSCTQASLRTGMQITPDYFRFADIVPADEHGGGWRAVCIKARVGQRIAQPQGRLASPDQVITCDFEFGTPLWNEDHGVVSLEYAQRVSAEVANHSAYKVLEYNTSGIVTAGLCERIKDVMNIYLGGRIVGSSVKRCTGTIGRKPVPVVHWPGG